MTGDVKQIALYVAYNVSSIIVNKSSKHNLECVQQGLYGPWKSLESLGIYTRNFQGLEKSWKWLGIESVKKYF